VATKRATAMVLGGVAALSVAACTSSRPPPVGPDLASLDPRAAAHARLLAQLDTFRVAGAVKTSDDLLLPESIVIEIKSEICVESREPGARFWSLDYDTCFAYTASDSVDEKGEYAVAVPCLDPDRAYESSHPFGDLRLVQRGPVSFVASSDAGWKHQETFTSSRTQRRDLILTLDTDTFYVVGDRAVFRVRPRAEAAAIREYGFGTGVQVVRFHQGWAQCLMERSLGWMEMRNLGTEHEMKELAPVKAKQSVETLPGSSR